MTARHRAELLALPIDAIRDYVDDFLAFAAAHADLTFQLTPIGCGLAGYAHRQIAPLFAGAPANVILPAEFAGLT